MIKTFLSQISIFVGEQTGQTPTRVTFQPKKNRWASYIVSVNPREEMIWCMTAPDHIGESYLKIKVWIAAPSESQKKLFEILPPILGNMVGTEHVRAHNNGIGVKVPVQGHSRSEQGHNDLERNLKLAKKVAAALVVAMSDEITHVKKPAAVQYGMRRAHLKYPSPQQGHIK
jgi:hypothetical protein